MWQAINEELAAEGLVVITVAIDRSPDDARPYIERAKATHPSLIDTEHRVADLYNMVNVPQAVWIDETGRIVRPPENAGSTDGFRARDPVTLKLPEAAIAERARVKQAYVAAVRDWARNGAASPHVLDSDTAAARLHLPDPAIAEAHAHFRLARHLLRHGNGDEAALHFAEASRLHPQSWNIWRQAAEKEPSGLAALPSFWARVAALGDKPYHRPIQMDGIG